MLTTGIPRRAIKGEVVVADNDRNAKRRQGPKHSFSATPVGPPGSIYVLRPPLPRKATTAAAQEHRRRLGLALVPPIIAKPALALA